MTAEEAIRKMCGVMSFNLVITETVYSPLAEKMTWLYFPWIAGFLAEKVNWKPKGGAFRVNLVMGGAADHEEVSSTKDGNYSIAAPALVELTDDESDWDDKLLTMGQ